MSNKIIFLDIDGVIATHKEFMSSTMKFQNKYNTAKELRLPYPFNQGCVKILNEILTITNAEIVLSSDWKLHWNMQELERIFKFNNIIKSPIDVTTSKKGGLDLEKIRAEEIKEYISTRNTKSYVIIDDLDLEPFNVERFVKTRDSEGLKQTGIKEKIVKYLTQ